jgi:hypothetical protein
VIVAVLDTGVAYEDYHQLPPAAATSRGITFVDPYDFVANTSTPTTITVTARTSPGRSREADQQRRGVAGVRANARIMPLKVLSA